MVASSGPDVVEFAASAGLILDDWQCWVLEQGCGEREDHKWAAFEACVIVPRQNGKGSILEALELYHLFVLHTALIVHSAHEFKTAREHFLRLQMLITNTPELWSQVCPGSGGHIHTANGAESVGTADGARLNFIARSGGSGRGFSGDLIVLDEAYQLPAQAVGAMGPTLSARPNPQVWYTSSAPHSGSLVLHGVRNRGLNHEGHRLFLADWSNDPGVELTDEEAKARVNPGYPHRLTPDNLAAEAEMLKGMDGELLRERFGVPEAEDSGAGIFGPGAWAACADPTSVLVGDPAIALDVSPGMAFASFAAAGLRADGLVHVELMERHPGTGWIVDRAKVLAEKYGPITVDPRGPASGVIEDLREAEVEMVELPDGELPRACATLQKDVIAGTLRHLGQPPLDAAVTGAAIRPAGDSWRWSRSGSATDSSPLVAATLARWAALTADAGPLVMMMGGPA